MANGSKKDTLSAARKHLDNACRRVYSAIKNGNKTELETAVKEADAAAEKARVHKQKAIERAQSVDI